MVDALAARASPTGPGTPTRCGRWDDHSDEDQARFARYMEVLNAAMVDNVDQNLARLLEVIEALGIFDNTVVVFHLRQRCHLRGRRSRRRRSPRRVPCQDRCIDRRSPVVWSVFEEYGPFPCTGDLLAVTYRPGAPAPYHPQHLVEAMRSAGQQRQ